MTPYEIKIKYEKRTEEGPVKMVTESYLLDALSFTEAEARITDQLLPSISGAYTVVSIKRATYSEVHTSVNGGYYYKCRVLLLTENEVSGKIKKIPVSILVEAPDVESAHKKLVQLFKGTTMDYRIAGVTETNIVDIFGE